MHGVAVTVGDVMGIVMGAVGMPTRPGLDHARHGHRRCRDGGRLRGAVPMAGPGARRGDPVQGQGHQQQPGQDDADQADIHAPILGTVTRGPD